MGVEVVFSGSILTKNIIVALVVGTILNIINQADALFHEQKSVVIWKGLLTYCVPFFVASFGAYSALTTEHGVLTKTSSVKGGEAEPGASE
jgi:hypothetical protein